MAFFGKKKHEFEEENNLIGKESDGFTVRFDDDDEEDAPSFFRGEHKAPHAITIDEVLHSGEHHSEDKPVQPTFSIPMSGSGEYSNAAKNLMSRMMKAKQAVAQVAEGAEAAPEKEEKAEEKAEDEPKAEKEPEADAKMVDEILAKAQKAARPEPEKEPRTEFASPEFMEKLKGFLNDDADSEPAAPVSTADVDAYSLASVDDILRSVEDKVKQRNLEESRKEIEINYNIEKKEEPAAKAEPAPEKEPEPKVTIFNESQEPIKIDVVHIDPADEDLESTRPVPLSYQFSFADEDLPNADIETVVKEAEIEEEDAGATIQFESVSAEEKESKDIFSSAEGTVQFKRPTFQLDPLPEEDEEEAEEFEDEYFEDYSCTDDAPEFKRDLKKRCTTLLIRMVPTAILTLLMGLFSLPVFIGADAENAVVFRLVSLFLFGITLIVNLNTVLGLVSIFRGQPDMDSPIGLTAVLAFIYSCCGVMSADTLFLGAPVGLVLLAVNFGKFAMEKRISKDFDRIATAESKQAINLIDEDQGSAEIAKGSGLENVLVCGTQRTVNITGFFKNCYAQHAYEKYIPAVLIAGGAIGVLAGAVSFVLSSSVVAAIGCMLALFLIFCPPTYCLLSVLPYISAAKSAAESGALMCGLGGAENISEANAVVFNADQLFPAGTVNLYQMKILSPNPVDRAIVEAAAVATAAKSPLAAMFNRMAQGREEIVNDPVDAINLEGNMGISGWIKDRRILIGNRLLMETHGISIPPVTVDRKILEKGFFPVYVACAGVPCALFVVGYNVDRRIRYELQRLCNTGAVILVNSTDPNISEEMISDYFGVYRESVRLMNANSLNVYKNAVNYQESFPASGLYNGSAEGLACLLTTSVRLKTAVKISTAVNFTFIALGTLLTCYSIFTGGLPAAAALALLVLHLLNLGAGFLVPLIYKP